MKHTFLCVQIIWMYLLCLYGCGGTNSVASQPTAILAATPAAAASTASATDQSQTPVRFSATIVPEPKGVRRSKTIVAVRVLVENSSPDAYTITVRAESTTPDLTFVLLDREINQTLGKDGLMITQTNIALEPSVSGQRSYRVLFLGFEQSAVVTAGTHQLIVRVEVPGQEPLMRSIVYEVAEG